MEIIYALHEPENKFLVRYVGKTTLAAEKRRDQHYWAATHPIKKRRSPLCDWIRSRGIVPDVIVLEEDPEDIDEAERWWIAELKSKGVPLLNVTSGGDGQPKGYVPSAETRAKVSASMIGRVVSDETRKKLSAALMGHETTGETRKKIGDANRGRTRTREVKDAASERASGDGNPMSRASMERRRALKGQGRQDG
jgi:hypothetical protein